MAMTVKEAASWLKARDKFLLLTHVRPDGDTIGSAAALCRALRNMGKEAYLLKNDGITATYVAYAEELWAPEDYVPAFVISVDKSGVWSQTAVFYLAVYFIHKQSVTQTEHRVKRVFGRHTVSSVK